VLRVLLCQLSYSVVYDEAADERPSATTSGSALGYGSRVGPGASMCPQHCRAWSCTRHGVTTNRVREPNPGPHHPPSKHTPRTRTSAGRREMCSRRQRTADTRVSGWARSGCGSLAALQLVEQESGHDSAVGSVDIESRTAGGTHHKRGVLEIVGGWTAITHTSHLS